MLLSPFHIPSGVEVQVLDATRRPPYSVLGAPLNGIDGAPVPGRLRVASHGIQGCIGEERRGEVNLAIGRGEVIEPSVVVNQGAYNLARWEGCHMGIVICVG